MYGFREKVLCQDCLKVKDFSQRRHNSEEPCECGGDFCGCESCIETINDLVAGKRSAEELGTQCDIEHWTEQDGIAKKEEV
tara:strand:- start:1707 stop:1949 length:243 start_codon:yes stop_codon:yes gene_type:complete